MKELKKNDYRIANLITKEEERQRDNLEMIPSENHTSKAVRQAVGSVLADKYAEGYPGKRYYAGLKFYDQIEKICQERARKIINVPYANVQPYSGSPANQAVYFAILKPGEKTMGMSLSHGGHLTHGYEANFSARYYRPVQYEVSQPENILDYKKIEKIVLKYKPKLIWVGATAYPRILNWRKFCRIAKKVNAYLAADISHIAGLIIAGAYPSPIPYVHVATTTTHKTLRGPRGGIIMVTKRGFKKDHHLDEKIDKAVFPGLQGGPHENNIAGIAVALKEASTASFKKYGFQIIKNSKVLAFELKKRGFNLITGGTDSHLILIDLRNKGISGKDAQERLEKAGIIVNKNTIPFDPNSPFNPSGIRIGTPAITTRGMKEKEMKIIAVWISEAISGAKPLKDIKEEVKNFCQKFPLP